MLIQNCSLYLQSDLLPTFDPISIHSFTKNRVAMAQDYSMDRLFFPVKATFITRYADYFILILVASVGLIGSLFVFTNRSMEMTSITFSQGNMPSNGQAAIAAHRTKDDFEHWIKIDGSLEAGSTVQFTFLQELKGDRYYLETGNGERIIITMSEFEYVFMDEGTFNLELKVLRDRLLHTLGTKRLNIK